MDRTKQPRTEEYLQELARLQAEQTAEREQSLAKEPESAQTFVPEEYHYFKYENFEKGVVISQADRDEAHRIILQEGYEDFRVVMKSSAFHQTEGTVGTATMYTKARERVTLSFDAEGVIDSRCQSWKCFYQNSPALKRAGMDPDAQRKICAHQAALLYLTIDYLKNKGSDVDATNSAGELFLTELSQRARHVRREQAVPAAQMQPLILEPYIVEEERGELSLCLRIGSGKLFKVKDIPEVLEALEHGRSLPFGKSTTLYLKKDKLGKTGLKLLNYVERVAREEDERQVHLDEARQRGSNFYDTNYAYELRDKIPLYGARMDDFFALYEGKSLEFQLQGQGRKEKHQLLLKERPLHLRATLQAVREHDQFEGISLTGSMPQLYTGLANVYYCRDASFCRSEKKEEQLLGTFAGASENGRFDVRIGRGQLKKFYREVLPYLRKRIDLKEMDDEVIARHIPPEAKLICYLDYQDGEVIAQAQAVYGNEAMSVTSPHREELTTANLLREDVWSPFDEAEQEEPVQELEYVPNAYPEDFNYQTQERNWLKEIYQKNNREKEERRLREEREEKERLEREKLEKERAQWEKKMEQTRLQEQMHASYRDKEAESAMLEQLREYFTEYDEMLDLLIMEPSQEVLFDFLDHGLDEMLETMEVHSTERFRKIRVRRKVNMNVGVSVTSGLLDLDITSDELTPEELRDLIDGYRRRQRFIRLRSGDFLRLEDNEQAEQLSEMMETLHISLKEFVAGKMHLPAYRSLYLDKMLEENQNIYADRDKHFRRLVKNFKGAQDSEDEVPEGLKHVLRSYQKAGYKWLRMLDHCGFGGILADEMGLGKTLQVITVLQAVKEETTAQAVAPAEADDITNTSNDGAGTSVMIDPDVAVHDGGGEEPTTSATSLIVCPASLVYNWGEELRRFAPDLKVGLVTGGVAERHLMINTATAYDVLVTSYDLLKRDIDVYDGIDFRFEVIDEAQYIKNHTTAAAKSVKLISARTKFALTGTPIENRLSELWSIFDYLMPGFLYEYLTFQREFEVPIVKGGEEEPQERLRRMVTPFVLRRLKADVLKDLPEKLEEIRYAGMESQQRKLYDAQVLQMKQTLASQSDSDFGKNKIQILAQLTKIRQICCDPTLAFDDYKGESAKRTAAMDLISTAIDSGHRILVFSQFVSMLNLLEEELKAAKIDYYRITGATPKKERVELVNEFNENEVPVFLISLKAGGTGLNLTGADVVIHYDPWWNLAAQNQATDRAHRIGQQKVVTVYKLIMKNTIEEKILELQEKKRQLSDDILGAEDVASTALHREELLELLT